MTPPVYPFSALVGLETLKTALLIAAVDGRLGVLLRGEKGSGKTTAARALAVLLPDGAFVDLPLGATEDRLLGGLDLARAMSGEPALKPGLLSRANGGLLYVDEVNLLPDHLADALLDAAASGVHVVEREGFSATQAAHFVLAGSMNPEEGMLRPQLLDRFALAVDVCAPASPAERRLAVERRLAYDADPAAFVETWRTAEEDLRRRIREARARCAAVRCPAEVMELATAAVMREGVTSLRADLAVVRASRARAAFEGRDAISADDVAAVLPLVLAHRSRRPPDPPRPSPPPPPAAANDPSPPETDRPTPERVFAVHDTPAPRVTAADRAAERRAGPAVRARSSEAPVELDGRTTLLHAVAATGSAIPRVEDLHEVVRAPVTTTRYLFVVDASGSLAIARRMELVKGAVLALLESSTGRRDEVSVIAFRGPSASVLLEPTRDVAEARRVLTHLPTGGRTPLAHALELAALHTSAETVVVLLTDGRANVPTRSTDAWADALAAARALRQPSLVVDTESGQERLGLAAALAQAMGATLLHLDDLETTQLVRLARERAGQDRVRSQR